MIGDWIHWWLGFWGSCCIRLFWTLILSKGSLVCKNMWTLPSGLNHLDPLSLVSSSQSWRLHPANGWRMDEQALWSWFSPWTHHHSSWLILWLVVHVVQALLPDGSLHTYMLTYNWKISKYIIYNPAARRAEVLCFLWRNNHCVSERN